MLGGTCANCVFSTVVGQEAISPAPTPVVSGAAVVGSTLTADPGTWAPGTSLAYQWLVDGNPVAGATSATFVPDVYASGLTVRVQVTGTLSGAVTTIRTSDPTSAVTKPVLATDVPTISGTPEIGKPLVATPGSGWPAGTYFTYQWAANNVNVSGATGPIYIPTVATQIGQTFTVTVTGAKAGYTSASVTSVPTAATVQGTQVLTPTPVITGNGRALSAQTANPGQWDDNVALAYAWSANGTPISGATSATYTPPVTLIGQTLTVTVTGTRAGVTTVSKTSEGTTIQPAAQVLQPTPTISGSPVVWQTLTLSPGTWDAGSSQSYQWLANGEPVDGATGLQYALLPDDAGKVFTASVTSTRTNYSTVTKTTAPTAAVALATLTATPVPTVSGTAQVTQTLTAEPGEWDPDVDLSYRWLADGEPISGATTDALTIGPAQLGTVITFAVTGTKPGFAEVTKTSEPTAEVIAAEFDGTPVPTISGSPKVGSELTAVAGAWDDRADLSYQWLADGDVIAGATESTYTPGAARVGAHLSVAVTGSAEGFTTVARISEQTDPVVLGNLSSTPDPVIAGTPQVGILLTAIPGDWDSGTELGYQWLADGDEIEGATSSEFVPGADQLGAVLSVTVTGTKDGYVTVVKTSDETDEVAIGQLTLTPVPQLSGSAPQVGVQLTAVPGRWDDGVTFSYRWLADGEVIDGATSATFTPAAAQLDASIKVEVTGSKAGYEAITRSSASTSAILPGEQALQPTPTITGSARFGSVLTGHPGSWDAGTGQQYQWYADNSPIPDATWLTFTPGADEIGAVIEFEVVSTRAAYNPVTKRSAPTDEVAPAVLTKTPTPKIVGTPKVAVILSAVTEPWDKGVTLAFQWSANGTPISGATGPTFLPGADEVGSTLTIAVTGSRPGYASVTRISAPTKVVALGKLVSTPKPKLAYTSARVGKVFTAVPGAWDAGTQLSFQWKRNGKAITGATDASYTATAADLKKTLSVTVTGTKPGYGSVTKTSAGKKVALGVQALKPRPAITGVLAIGQTLSVVPAEFDPGVTVSYTWYRDGKKVGTGTELTITPSMKGHRIWVTSKATKSGFSTVTLTSVKTPKVPASIA
jgi:hypothetical protein